MNKQSPGIIMGAEQIDSFKNLLNGKAVALMVNQTSLVGKTHLVDTLLRAGVDIKKVFAPEHGFRGTADAGEHVNSARDSATGLAIVSLYGEHKKPTAADLKDVDVVIFDIQDVGARFYTYISSLHYLMEACAENNKGLIVLDRPNPNGWYIDGPVLKPGFKSFVGVDPIPVVHGLTVGEYAQMVNGEKWLANGVQCKLKVITCLNYNHATRYAVPVKPSPNLPNNLSIELYPAICFFEGTNISVGRGTDKPFQVIGGPDTKFEGAYQFTPKSVPGAKTPPFLNTTCYGYDLTKAESRLRSPFLFRYVLKMYQQYQGDKSTFFLKSGFFDTLCGTDEIRKMIIAGKSAADIASSYQAGLETYKVMRQKYVLYP